MIHLDSSYLIRAVLPGSPEGARLGAWLSSGEQVEVGVVAWAEFLCGPLAPGERRLARTLAGEPVPLTRADAARGAELFNLAGRRRGSLADCLIAATCLRVGAVLATNNVDDFRRFEPAGLRLATP